MEKSDTVVGDDASTEDFDPKAWLRFEPDPGNGAPRLPTDKPSAREVDAQLVGKRLREFRKRHGHTIRQLAARLEMSPSMISQIETGKTQPSVRTLYAIVNELNISLDELLEPEVPESAGHRGEPPGAAAGPAGPLVVRASTRDRVQRAGERQVIELEAGVKWELLATSHDPDMEFIHHVYAPGGASSPDGILMRHTGREFGIVLRGRLGITIGFDQYFLLPGDSILFDSTTPHRLHNDGDEEVHSIWMIYGRNP